MIDVPDEIKTIRREVGERAFEGGEGRTVLIRRSYDAPVDDIWDAVTNPDRISRWFLPVSGDLRLGGTYQLKGNAHGEILRCEPPRLLKVTWIFGESSTEVEVRLTAGGDGSTVFELKHAMPLDPEHWGRFGPGAVGVGWDLTVLGLGLHLRGEMLEDPDAWVRTAEAREFMTLSSRAWGAAHEAAGASVEEATTAMEHTRQAYFGEPASDEPNGD
jgi:uncharacterized protein YndB with AHSA1/START domain